ncbi:LANO_0B05952g1_1 [Lachancea nothofagi CBS 11611]|uniref:LANO_0B05952g1_1 n=1 Tax=Lachancea nothofagi CBS 11611 TaxID=1266666 RepID=A0A1G4IZ20_9SACH|nr:LANO_0B05952g1_1 [Lachancea nothofagi CBS 11611]
MARIGYVAPYFMPLMCSSKPWIKIILFVNVLGLFGLAYGLAHQLLISQYDDQSMFKPNGQDYFRASLLGFFSPFALYFLRDFLLMLSPRAILINLFVDFPFNDWFCLLIIFCLAYPQLQAARITGTIDETIWHIIPKQSAVFGISWSLCELLICLVQNLHRYEEVPSPESAKRNMETQVLQEEQGLVRNNITLSKCIDVKRKASLISENVYSHEDPPHSQMTTSNPDEESTDTVFVSFNDSSISLLRDSEQGNTGSRPRSRDRHPGLFNGSVIYFPEIVSKRVFIKELLVFNLLVIDSILLLVGNAFIISMYFIYVPGHDWLFSPAVRYFGSRTFGFFILRAILPLSTLSFVMSVFLFVWNDTGTDSSDSLHKANSDLHIHSSQPQSLQYISSDQLFVMNSIYTQDLLTTDDDNEILILRVFRKIMSFWRSVSNHRSFPIVGLTIWSTIMFSLGTFGAIQQ